MFSSFQVSSNATSKTTVIDVMRRDGGEALTEDEYEYGLVEERDSLSICEENEYVEGITASEHMIMLEENKKKAIDDGYMLEKIDYDNLHYEDPMVTKLKQTDVSTYIVIIIVYLFRN